MKKLFSSLVIVTLALSLTELLRGQTDLFLGTWKLNVKKSSLSLGPRGRVKRGLW